MRFYAKEVKDEQQRQNAMFLITKLLIGAVMIGITVIIHAVMCDFVFRFIENHMLRFMRIFKRVWKIAVLISTVFMLGAAIMTDIWLWTILFYALEYDVLKNIETALYFTTITFTTVGFGDVVLPPEWRLLSASTAINGMLIFGWSTAFIFEIMASLYKPKDRNWIRYGHDEKHH